MIARFWEADLAPGRGADYDAFVAAYSRPMFAALPGCAGALFLGRGERRVVLSLWTGQAAIDALAESTLYRSVVRRLEDSGLLVSAAVTGVSPVTAFAPEGWPGLRPQGHTAAA